MEPTTEIVQGRLEIDYSRKRVIFYPKGSPALLLPLSPADIEAVRYLTKHENDNYKNT